MILLFIIILIIIIAILYTITGGGNDEDILIKSRIDGFYTDKYIISSVPNMPYKYKKKYGDTYFYTNDAPVVLGPYEYINKCKGADFGEISSAIYFEHKTGIKPANEGNFVFKPNISPIFKYMRFYIKIIVGPKRVDHSFIIKNNTLYSSWVGYMQFRKIGEINIKKFFNDLYASNMPMKYLINIFKVKRKYDHYKGKKNIFITYTYANEDCLFLTDPPETLYYTDYKPAEALITACGGKLITSFGDKSPKEIENKSPKELKNKFSKEYPVIITADASKFKGKNYSYIIEVNIKTKKISYIYPEPAPYIGTINFDKLADPVPKEFNPPVKIIKTAEYFIFRDDFLAGGTKQRGLYNLVKNTNAKILIYVGPPQGAAQIALGVLASHFKRTGIMFYVAPAPSMHPMSKKAEHYGTILKYAGKTDEEAKITAQNYIDSLKSPESAIILPFGLWDNKFTYYFVSALKQAVPVELQNKPIRIWVVIGSGTLVNALYYVFPRAYFMVVQVGLKRYWHSVDPSRSRVFISGYKFSESPAHTPPYPSVSSYDAKIWELVARYGKAGDYIWNVATEKI